MSAPAGIVVYLVHEPVNVSGQGCQNVPFFESPAVVCAVGGALLASSGAEAKPRRHSRVIDHSHDTIIVRPRNFLDSGVVVPVGSLTPYMEEMTRFYIPELGRTSPGILWQPDPTFSPFSPGFPFEF